MLRKRLRPDADPNIFPNLPAYLTVAPTVRRTIATSAVAHLDREKRLLSDAIDEMVRSDEVSSWKELNARFNSCYFKPCGFHHLHRNKTSLSLKVRCPQSIVLLSTPI